MNMQEMQSWDPDWSIACLVPVDGGGTCGEDMSTCGCFWLCGRRNSVVTAVVVTVVFDEWMSG